MSINAWQGNFLRQRLHTCISLDRYERSRFSRLLRLLGYKQFLRLRYVSPSRVFLSLLGTTTVGYSGILPALPPLQLGFRTCEIGHAGVASVEELETVEHLGCASSQVSETRTRLPPAPLQSPIWQRFWQHLATALMTPVTMRTSRHPVFAHFAIVAET